MKKSVSSGSRFSLWCGIIGTFGSIAAIVTDIIGIILLDNYDPIGQTISALAIGKYGWVQDIGLNLYAIAMVACSLALYSWNLGGLKWKIGSILLGLLGIDIIIIAEYDRYAGQGGMGSAIHLYCVYALGILFTAITLLLAFGLRKIGRNWYRYSLGTSIFWLVLAPIFFVAPNSLNGAYERFLSLITLAWVTAISLLLIKRGRGQFSK
ncbi:MAG: DUF998 domain-containing protein [Prochloraceae cyanobacterium]